MEFLQLTPAQRAVMAMGKSSADALSQLSNAVRQTFATLWYSGQSPMKWQAPTHTPEQLAALPQEDQDAIAAAAANRETAMAEFKTATAARLAAMGTNAGPAFDQHARTVAYLLDSGISLPAAYYTPPFAFTRAEDGTITLN